MKVCILNNWINTKQWWFYKLFDEIFNGTLELVNDPINCDILLHSVFGNDESYKHSKAKYKILFSHECRFYIDIFNEREQYSDFTITYKPNSKTNIRVPLWYCWIDWWNEQNKDELIQVCAQSHHYIGKNFLQEEFVPTPENIKSNLYSGENVVNRDNFCCMLVGNKEPDSIQTRGNIYNLISQQISPIVGYGLAFNNRFEGNKIDLLRNFRFNVCYENSNQKGYVTEKLFDAKFAGCIPLYWGDPLYSKIDFNEKCFINRLDFDSDFDFIQQISKLEKDKSYFVSVCEEPLFTENQYPNLESIFERVKEFVR